MEGNDTKFGHFETEHARRTREAREIIGRHVLLREDPVVQAMAEANFIDAAGNAVDPKVFLAARFQELERAVREIGLEFVATEETGGHFVEHARPTKY